MWGFVPDANHLCCCLVLQLTAGHAACCFWMSKLAGRCTTLNWLNSPGIYHGRGGVTRVCTACVGCLCICVAYVCNLVDLVCNKAKLGFVRLPLGAIASLISILCAPLYQQQDNGDCAAGKQSCGWIQLPFAKRRAV